MTQLPDAIEFNVINCACISVGKPGNGSVKISCALISDEVASTST